MSHWADRAAMLAILIGTTKSFEHATAAVHGTVLFCEWFMTIWHTLVLLSSIFSMLLEDILLSLGESSTCQMPYVIFQILPPPTHNCNNHSLTLLRPSLPEQAF